MKSEELIVEARAKIIWGEEISSVRDFLMSNGMSATEADAKLRNLPGKEMRRSGGAASETS